MDPSWRREQKYRFLEQNADRSSIDWTEEKVDKSGFWLPVESKDEFADFVPLADKTERSKTGKPSALFGQFSHGVYTGRDSVVYNFNRAVLEDNVQEFIATYNSEVDRWVRAGRPKDVDNFVDYQSLKWTRNTKRDLTNLQFCKFEALRVRVAVYRPFVKSFLYLQDILVDEPGQLNSLIPSDKAANRILWLKVGSEWPSFMLCTDSHSGLPATGRLAMFPVLHLRRRRHPPPREHRRLGARTIPLPLRRPVHHQVGHLPLHLRRPAPPRLPPALCRQSPPRTPPRPFRKDHGG